jgi:quinol monooxygenase YgiN
MQKNQNYTASFVVEQSPQAVFAAVTNPRAWWSEDIEGDTDRVGAVFYYHYQDIHRGTFKVTEMVPGKKVVWHVVQNYFNFVEDSTEWTGTDIVFEIAPKDGGTELRFTHVGLVPAEECYEVCQDSWGFYLRGSLRSLIATGTGQPNKGEANANPTVVPPPSTGTGEAGPQVAYMTSAAAKPGLEAKVGDALRDVARAALGHPGCIDYAVVRSEMEPNVTICVERWATNAQREAFLRSDAVKTFVTAITGAFLESPKPAAYSVLDLAA